jgi:hypothetical protein
VLQVQVLGAVQFPFIQPPSHTGTQIFPSREKPALHMQELFAVIKTLRQFTHYDMTLKLFAVITAHCVLSDVGMITQFA